MQEHETISRISEPEIRAVIVAWLRAVGDGSQETDRDTRLDDLDVDSLDLVEIADQAHARWGVSLEVADVKDVVRVGDFIDLVMAQLA